MVSEGAKRVSERVWDQARMARVGQGMCMRGAPMVTGAACEGFGARGGGIAVTLRFQVSDCQMGTCGN